MPELVSEEGIDERGGAGWAERGREVGEGAIRAAGVAAGRPGHWQEAGWGWSTVVALIGRKKGGSVQITPCPVVAGPALLHVRVMHGQPN